MKYVIELEPGVWFASWRIGGDPSRTLVRDNARRYATKAKALRALAYCRRYRPFYRATITEVRQCEH